MTLDALYQDNVIGVDEVGYGAFAGPVVVAAVRFIKKADVLPEILSKITDSKKLSAKTRLLIFSYFKDNKDLIEYSIAFSCAKEVDTLNVLKATQKAMVSALQAIQNKDEKTMILIDGNRPLPILEPQQTIIKGDQKSLSIATASILAKVTRDLHMIELSKEYPQFGFQKHKGYGTASHIKAIHEFGLSQEHRKSYRCFKDL